MLYLHTNLHLTTVAYTTNELQYNYTRHIELQIYLHCHCLHVNC